MKRRKPTFRIFYPFQRAGWIARFVISIVVGIVLFSCNKKSPAPSNPVPRGTRNLGVHVVQAENQDFLQALTVARTSGMNLLPLIFQWSEIDGNRGYDPDHLIPAIDLVLPDQQLALSLTISPIAADRRDLPPGLAGLPFDDPLVINTYIRLIDSLAKGITQTRIRYFLLGNEVDLYFSNHIDEWAHYIRFCEAIAPVARAAFGADCKIGAECTVGSTATAQLPYIQALNANLDVAVFTYYPINDQFIMQPVRVVSADLENLLQRLPGKRIMLEETGYATGTICQGSNQLQADFVKEIFSFWDRHPEQLECICFLWLTDLSLDLARQTAADYGVNGSPIEAAFVDCIRTLGMHTREGVAKPGFIVLKEQAGQRGWK